MTLFLNTEVFCVQIDTDSEFLQSTTLKVKSRIDMYSHKYLIRFMETTLTYFSTYLTFLLSMLNLFINTATRDLLITLPIKQG